MRYFVVLLLLFNCILAQGQVTGNVVGVSDGDTFTLLTKENKAIKVRLYGIDCPEKNQPFGQRAKQFTSDRIFSKTVRVIIKDTDRYSRVIAMVYEPSGKCINEELLKAGLAWHYKQYDKHNLSWTNLEIQAKANKAGLWCEKDCMAPWDWRKQKRINASKKKAA